MNQCTFFCFWSFLQTTCITNFLKNQNEGTFDSEIKCVKRTVVFDVDEDGSFDAWAGVVVGLLGFDKDIEVFMVSESVSHSERTFYNF